MACMSRLPAARQREQEIAALELSTAGHSVDTIADRLGVSPRTAARRLQRGLKRIPAYMADELRRLSEERLNSHIRRLNAVLADGVDIDTEIKIRNLLLSCERERIQLYGLRMPAAYVVQIEQGEAQ